MLMILGWMQLKIFLVQMMKYIILIIKEIIHLKNLVPAVILVIFNLSFMEDSVQDFGCLENL